MLETARHYFRENNKTQAIEKLRAIIRRTSENDDFKATGACFILCGLIEYYYREYTAACEYFIQLVYRFIFMK